MDYVVLLRGYRLVPIHGRWFEDVFDVFSVLNLSCMAGVQYRDMHLLMPCLVMRPLFCVPWLEGVDGKVQAKWLSESNTAVGGR